MDDGEEEGVEPHVEEEGLLNSFTSTSAASRCLLMFMGSEIPSSLPSISIPSLTPALMV